MELGKKMMDDRICYKTETLLLLCSSEVSDITYIIRLYVLLHYWYPVKTRVVEKSSSLRFTFRLRRNSLGRDLVVGFEADLSSFKKFHAITLKCNGRCPE